MNESVVYTLSLRDLISNQLKSIDGTAKNLEGTMSDLQSSIMKVGAGIGIAFGLNEIKNFAMDVIDTGSKLETLNNVINYTSLNAADAAENHAFLQRMIHDYKLPVMETTEGFSSMNAALMGSALQGEKARKIFEGVTTGVTAMHLSGAQANQVFMALNQMVSKGTVQSQELKLQLGNALPGAFQLAAKAMGMTTAQFTKQVEAGNVLANDFLPKFAQALQDKFGGAIPTAVQSTVAKMTDMHNSFIELKQTIFNDMEPAIKAGIDRLKGFVEGLKDVWGWLMEHKRLIRDVATALGIAGAAWLTYKGIMLGALIVTKASVLWETIQYASITLLGDGMLTASAATKAWTGMQILLNAAFAANPIGFVITAIAAVTAAVIYAYNHFSKFRAAVWAAWAVLKEFASIVTDIFTGLYHQLHGLFTFNWDEYMLGGQQGVDAVFNSAKRLGKAAKKGWDEGLADFAKDNPAEGKTGTPKTVTPAGGSKPGTNTVTPGADTGTSKVSGTKSYTINIKIDNLIKDFQIKTTNITEGTAKIKELVTQALLSAVNDSQIVAGQ
ncbi:tape measure protein [Chitinophaga sp. CC14]|uniref:tape measure protein n=1 Tax=Chitinophaga sp. CC14 TaxID=3029199 RepID=UPI003B7E9DA1